MTGLQAITCGRVESCLSRMSRLTLGEIELLEAIRANLRNVLSLVEEQELKKIERKLGFE